MVDWIIQNKEWLFSGVAIAVGLGIISIIRYFSKGSNSSHYGHDQRYSDNAANFHAGRDLNVSISKGKQESNSNIQIANNNDIKKYDPKVNQISQLAEEYNKDITTTSGIKKGTRSQIHLRDFDFCDLSMVIVFIAILLIFGLVLLIINFIR